MSSSSDDKKILLLQTGQEIFATHGFTNVGLTELLKKAGIPKGSFYYYFSSKEEYGVEVIRFYMNEYTNNITNLFSNSDLSCKDRLLSYLKTWQGNQCTNEFYGRCLIVKLSSEVSDLSEAMRHEFCIGTKKILTLITQILKDGQEDGSVPEHLDPAYSAQELYQQWLGASLLTKIQRNDCPFETALHYTYNLLKI